MTDWEKFKDDIGKLNLTELEGFLVEEKLNLKRSEETYETINREAQKALAITVENELKLDKIQEELDNKKK